MVLKNPKGDPSKSQNAFSPAKNFLQVKEYHFTERERFRKKSRFAEKTVPFCKNIGKTIVSLTELKIDQRLPLKLGKRFCSTENLSVTKIK